MDNTTSSSDRAQAIERSLTGLIGNAEAKLALSAPAPAAGDREDAIWI